MAPPPPAQASLVERLKKLATTLQFAWFVGHATLLLSVFRYFLSYITLNYYSTWAQLSYRLAFISAVVTYGIVVFKAYRARLKPGTSPQQLAVSLLSDENVQYLLISLVWLFSRQLPLALLPFTVYSLFHVATYTRTNLIPVLQPPKTVAGATPTSPGASKSQSALANAIGRFVKEYYDVSMGLVAGLEIALWFRLLFSAITFSKRSWILLTIYTIFLRARFAQSHFVQNAFAQGTAKIDQQVNAANVAPAAKQAWETTKRVGKQVIEALAQRTGATLIGRPVLLGAIYRATAAPQGAAGSASDVFNPTKKAVSNKTFQRALARLGVEHRNPPRHPVKTTKALRLLYHVNEGAERWGLTHELYRKYWVEGKDVSDSAVLVESVRKVLLGRGRAEEVVRAIEAGLVEGQRERALLEEATTSALDKGAFGLPAFWLPQEEWADTKGARHRGKLYWGQDRMNFVEAAALLIREGKNGQGWGQIKSVALPALLPRLIQQRSIPNGEEAKLEFWYDFSSPWAYLGWTQLPRLQRQFGDRLHIEMKPFLVGILFREIGAPNLPASVNSAARRAYDLLDHNDWVRWWNAVNEQEGNPDKPVDFYWNDIFPIRTPLLLRALLVQPDLAAPLYRACWVRNLDMASEKVLAQVIDEAGYDARAIIEQANSPAVKSDLRARTEEAKRNGLCGVPTYRVFRRRIGERDWKQVSDVIWGQDQVAAVEDLLSGWDETQAVGLEAQHAKL
ncbi:hypothetical protein DV735_g3011, partial [Chaetothyriales sp. CBS 134920]